MYDVRQRTRVFDAGCAKINLIRVFAGFLLLVRLFVLSISLSSHARGVSITFARLVDLNTWKEQILPGEELLTFRQGWLHIILISSSSSTDTHYPNHIPSQLHCRILHLNLNQTPADTYPQS